MFRVWDKVAHPMHGAGVIDGIVQETVAGSVQDYYVFRMPVGGLVLKIPTATSGIIGLRGIVDPGRAAQLIGDLAGLEVEQFIGSWNQRYRENMQKLKSGDLAVEVTVSPIEIIPLLTDDFMQQSLYDILDDNGIETQDQMDALSDDEYQVLDEKYALVLLDELERLIDDLTYGEDQVIMLQMKKDSDGYYTLVESGWQKLDEVMIDYSGTYAK